jgi:DNA-3-methyladenine glycosylase
MRRLLGRRFFSRHPTKVARDLIGKTIVRRLDDGTILEGIITETEAYGGKEDPASHAFRGITPRNRVMFGRAGRAYVYFTYGFHHCLNFVTGKYGLASAVLIRAIEPTKGLEVMALSRKTTDISALTNGPGKLCQAMSIDRSLNGIDAVSRQSEIFVLDTGLRPRVATSTRVGISKGKEKKWRFFKSNDRLSKTGNLVSSKRQTSVIVIHGSSSEW